MSDSILLNNSFRHDGYPACNDPMAPPGCGAKFHYETLPYAADDPNTVVMENGVDTTIATDAIISPGHSGGPFWYFSGGSPRIIGTQVGGDNSGTLTGVFRRFTSTSIAQINTWVCLAGPCM